MTGRGRARALPYRPCVGVMLLDGRGRVFVARRRDRPDAWQMPQGGINPGEDPAEAALRELAEEVGTAKARIIAETEGWHAYDLPEHLVGRALGGRYRGQRQKWFAMRFEGSEADIDLARAPHPEFDDWRWVEPETLLALIVPFKRPVYEAVIDEFREVLDAAG